MGRISSGMALDSLICVCYKEYSRFIAAQPFGFRNAGRTGNHVSGQRSVLIPIDASYSCEVQEARWENYRFGG